MTRNLPSTCKRLSRIATLLLIFCALGGENQSAYAQKRGGLFSMCVFTGSGNDTVQDVVIGRQLFTSIQAMWADGRTATCRIRPGNSRYKYSTLKLAFGVPDRDAEAMGICRKPITVNIYLDGNLSDSRSLEPGESALVLQDVSRTSSVAIEVPRVGSCWKTVHFVQAVLEPISTSPGQR